MQVSKIMSTDVVTISEQAGLERAVALMKKYDIRHLPVVEGDRLVGLVAERDLREAIFPAMLEELTIKDIMVSDPATVEPDALLEDAARLAYRRKIGCLPVVDRDGKLKGIITVADMLAALIEVMGFLSASSRMDVALPDRSEALEEACRIIGRHGGRILSVSLTRLRRDQPVHLFRLQKTDLTPIVEKMTEAGFSVLSTLG